MSAFKRIHKEAEQLRSKPCREFLAYPTENNPFEWKFTMRGPEGSCYERGVYHGKLTLPTDYPYAPPDVMLTTPNGRFETEVKLCLSEVTSYHPENWQPSWGIHTVLHALREFMNTKGSNAVGAIEYPLEERLRLAEESRSWVSPQGVSMEEHLRLLNTCPPWAEREAPRTSSSNPSPAQGAVPPEGSALLLADAAVVVAAAVAAAAKTAAAQAAVARVPEAAPPQRDNNNNNNNNINNNNNNNNNHNNNNNNHAPPHRTREDLSREDLWQLEETTLNNFILMLLVGIFAILSKKYFSNELL